MHDPAHGALDDIAEELEAIERRSPLARTLVTVAITLVVAGLVIGAVLLASVLVRETRTAASTVDLGGAPQVALRAASADLRVVQAEGDRLEVSAEVTSGLLETTYELRRRDDEIEVVSSCQSWLNPGCGVEVTIAVPKGLPLVVATGSGDVDARDLTGGVLTIGTDSGDVRTSGLDVDELTVETVEGDVDATLARDPFAVKATTDVGDVRLRLPGEEAFAVRIKTDSGDVRRDLDAADDPSRFVRVTTGSGDVVVERG